MNVLALDSETTTSNKGSPYDQTNKMVCWSFANEFQSETKPTSKLNYCCQLLETTDLVIGFNFKFDLHWFLKEGVDQLRKKQIWDVQIAEFILSHQTNRFPSLNETCIKYGLEEKLDVVKTEYWDKGINTDAIPWDVLSSYATKDAELTLQCYHIQRKLMTQQQIQLCYLMCQDLQILQEMEMNGLYFDEELCVARSSTVEHRLNEITKELSSIYPNIPINFGSGHQLSSFLYGGIIEEEGKELVGLFKTGLKAGQPKYKNTVTEHILPRLYEPLKGSEMKAEGKYATDEGTLRKLKGKKYIVALLLERSKLEKLNGTYYKGLIDLRREMNWEPNTLHGNFNQTTAQTGRLSSNKPNQQNFATELLDIFVSQYNE